VVGAHGGNVNLDDPCLVTYGLVGAAAQETVTQYAPVSDTRRWDSKSMFG